MKTMQKRILSLFLAVMMIVSVIPMGTISASAANGLPNYGTGGGTATRVPANSNGIQVRLDQIVNELKTKFPNGVFTADGQRCYDETNYCDCSLYGIVKAKYPELNSTIVSKSSNGWDCAAFAKLITVLMFGTCKDTNDSTIGPANSASSYNSLRMGDLFYTGHPHWMIYISHTSTTVTVLDANGYGDQQIGYYRTYSLSNGNFQGQLTTWQSPHWDEVNNKYNTTYTVSYNANGGTGAPSSQTKTYGQTLTLSSTKPTRTGYTFLGWSTSSTATSATYSAGGSYTANSSATFYAVWKANSYTVKYNSNGGTGTMSNSSHTYNTAKALNANGFTRTGYTFLGWSTNSSATSATYTDKQSVKNLTATNGGTVTLYAVWQKNPATVSSISIQSKPSKTVYTVGETFSSSGLAVKVNMSDGTSKTVTSGFTVSSPDMTTAGTKTVTVTYQGKTATFNITVNKAVSSTSAQYKMNNATASAGSTVEMYVSVKNNPGIISLRNKITYDTSVMELVKVEDMKLLAGYTTPSPTVDSPYTLRWADSLAKVNNTANGNIVKLTFKIKDSAQAGDYGVSVSHIEARTANGEKVEFADCNAVITVMDYIPGDVDGNGEVDDWDAIVLNRYLAGWKTEVSFAAADMDGDGELTDWDAIALERKLAGWDV